MYVCVSAREKHRKYLQIDTNVKQLESRKLLYGHMNGTDLHNVHTYVCTYAILKKYYI